MKILLTAIPLFLIPAAAGANAPKPPGSTIEIGPAQAPSEESRLVDQAAQLIRAGKSADALPVLDRVIALEEARYGKDQRVLFSARSLTQGLIYSTFSDKLKKEVVVLGPDWGLAVFLKGFALVDLGRPDEAKPFLDRAVALSPMDAQYQAELGEWYKSRKDWARAYAAFEQASTAAEFSPEEAKSFEKRRALRGMGFALSEQGKFDEAEKLFRQCLKLDPNDAGAKQELEYIREQREKLARHTG